MAIGAKKSKYVYVDDAGKNWIVSIAEDRVAAVTPSTGLTIFDPANPPNGGIQGRLNPKRCRRVHAAGTVTIQTKTEVIKRDFICLIGSALYAINNSQTVSYTPDGEGTPAAVTMITTGRRGERISF